MKTAFVVALGFAGVVCVVIGLVGGFFAGYYTPRDWDRPTPFHKDTGSSLFERGQFQVLGLVALGLLAGATLAALALLGLDAAFHRTLNRRSEVGEYTVTPSIGAIPAHPLRGE